MHKDLYHQKTYHTPDKLIVDLDLLKFLMIIITVFLFFVIPAQVITHIQSNSSLPKQSDEIVVAQTVEQQTNPTTDIDNSEGRVAGAITQNANPANNKNNQAQLFAILGIFFVGISILSIGYLAFFDKEPIQKSNYY